MHSTNVWYLNITVKSTSGYICKIIKYFSSIFPYKIYKFNGIGLRGWDMLWDLGGLKHLQQQTKNRLCFKESNCKMMLQQRTTFLKFKKFFC